MAEFKVQVGGIISIPTLDEIASTVRGELSSWRERNLSLANYGQRRQVQVTLDSNGDGTALLTLDNSAAVWIVRRVSAYASATAAGNMQVFQNLDFVATLLDASDGATLDAGDAPLYVRRGETLKFVWDGGPASGIGYTTVYYDEHIAGGGL